MTGEMMSLARETLLWRSHCDLAELAMTGKMMKLKEAIMGTLRKIIRYNPQMENH